MRVYVRAEQQYCTCADMGCMCACVRAQRALAKISTLMVLDAMSTSESLPPPPGPGEELRNNAAAPGAAGNDNTCRTSAVSFSVIPHNRHVWCTELETCVRARKRWQAGTGVQRCSKHVRVNLTWVCVRETQCGT